MRHRPLGSLGAAASRTSLRLLLLAGATLLVVAAVGLLQFRAHAESGRLMAATRAARLVHEGMLDQASAVRGYLVAPEERFVARYVPAAAQLDDAWRDLESAVAAPADLFPLVVDAEVAAQAWREHADAVGLDRTRPRDVELVRFIDRDQELFDDYRDAHSLLIEAVTRARDGVVSRQGRLLAEGAIVQVGLLQALVVEVLLHRRRIARRVVAPVGELQDVIAKMAAGDLAAKVPHLGYDELRAAGAGLEVLGDSLVNEQVRAQLRADLLAAKAADLEELLRTSREISGNLDLRYVVEAIAAAARRLTGWSHATVHLVDAPEPLPEELRPVVSTATVDSAAGRAAFPMVIGGVVVGVLRCVADDATARLREQQHHLLLALASHGAAAVEAARLHSRLAEESRVDALTGLPNRRSLDETLVHELERSRRYGRPLSLLMIDLDHFKAVNDLHGHQVGDAVLRAVGEVLMGQLRATDTAYRYGGEELTVLLRETEIEAAADVAERLRRTLERGGAAGIDVTGSFGAVQAQPGEDAASLLRRADGALYDAKHGGRNRVARGARVPAMR